MKFVIHSNNDVSILKFKVPSNMVTLERFARTLHIFSVIFDAVDKAALVCYP